MILNWNDGSIILLFIYVYNFISFDFISLLMILNKSRDIRLGGSDENKKPRWEFMHRLSKSLWNSFLVRLGVSLLLIRYTGLYLVTVSFLLRYQNDQGRYIHFLHTRQNVFYTTYPYPVKSQQKWRPAIPWSIKQTTTYPYKKTKGETNICQHPILKVKSKRKRMDSMKIHQTKIHYSIFGIFKNKIFYQMVISKQKIHIHFWQKKIASQL